MEAREEGGFAELLMRGAREAAAHAAGDPGIRRKSAVTRRPLTARDVRLRRPARPTPEHIRRIRGRLALSQAVFGDLLNVSRATVRAWEQGQRLPDGPSLRLLEIAERHPDVLVGAATVSPNGAAPGRRE
jgi:putative transcriptional regulator